MTMSRKPAYLFSIKRREKSVFFFKISKLLTQIISTSCVNYRLVNICCLFLTNFIQIIRLSYYYLFYTNISKRNQFNNMLSIVTYYYYMLLLSNSIKLFHTSLADIKTMILLVFVCTLWTIINVTMNLIFYSYYIQNNREILRAKYHPLKIQNSNLILQNILLSGTIAPYIFLKLKTLIAVKIVVSNIL